MFKNKVFLVGLICLIMVLACCFWNRSGINTANAQQDQVDVEKAKGVLRVIGVAAED